MAETIILVGAGGHARACIDVIEQGGQYAIRGLVDNSPTLRGERIFGYPVLGCDADLPSLLVDCRRVLICVGQIETPKIRRRLFEYLCGQGAELPCIVSPYAALSPHATLSQGVMLGHGAIVHAGASVGENSIINSRALVEHDASIGAHCHVATGALINGNVVVEDECFIGSGAILREGVRIGAGSFIAAGSLVVRDCLPGTKIRRAA